MARLLVTLRVMPDSPSTALDVLETTLRSTLQPLGADVLKVEQEPVAFGLIALKLIFSWDEQKSTDVIERAVASVAHVESADIVDMRRALG